MSAEITPHERSALAQVEQLTDPAKLRTLIANARRQKSSRVEAAAFARLCFVQPEATPGTVEHDVWQSIHALEQMLREERGKTILLSRTRQKIAKDGEAKTVSDLTLKPTASKGFDDLVSRGHAELTFEAVVLRHPKTFDDVIYNAARVRLEDANVDLEPILLPVTEA
ncbi:hypothetical protein [Litoreibacter janthinus]|uniref:Uncharacterized protein n=1 Tax=Litoreibacter janthinus TaxID=670154 RepID=A0A1I6GVY9_9RHOB|nr:hypothetical protein [Litoreibacter janthinus]SFR46249.1 hypothetical protein SAMN04488002_2046 [Litoreibacter janthinus]